MKICLVTSGGGHLFHLYMLKQWWSKYDRFWVAPQKDDVISLLRNERTYWSYYPVTRNYRNLIRNTLLALKVLLKEKADLIISTGGGVAIPFFYMGKLLKAKLVFIEVLDGIVFPTWTGRVVYPIVDSFFLQLEEQKRFYPKGEVLGKLIGGLL